MQRNTFGTVAATVMCIVGGVANCGGEKHDSDGVSGSGGTVDDPPGGTGTSITTTATSAASSTTTSGTSIGGAGGTSIIGDGGASPIDAAGAAGEGGEPGEPTANFSVSYQLASDVDATAPGTVGIVTWSVDAEPIVDAEVHFGLSTDYGITAPAEAAERTHRTLLLGMKPSRAYHFQIQVRDSTTTYKSADYVIETGPPTDLVPLASYRVLNAAKRQAGYIITSYWRNDGKTVPFILDSDGDVVWWYESALDGIGRARMSADGKNMWLTVADTVAPLRRVSLDTLEAETYQNTLGSHDITPVNGEIMAYIDYGEDDCDSIFEIDPSGTTREVFESTPYLDPEACHGNALRYSQAEDVYTFSDHTEDIFVVSRTGEVQWRLSELVGSSSAAWGGESHGHQLLGDRLILFANRGGPDRVVSALVEYSLLGEELRRYENGLFSRYMGDVQRLPAGNTLITYPVPSIIDEVDPNGEVVLEIDGGGSWFGHAIWRKSLYGSPPDIAM